MNLLGLSPERFPDEEVADLTFYLWQTEEDVWPWRRSGVRGRRHLRYPDDAALKGHLGFVVARSIDGIATCWPGHLFRVGDVKGLLRRSFRDDIDRGWCEALTILEEVPPTLAFGPGGEAAASIAARAASFSVDDIEAVGEAARPFGPELLRDRPIRQRSFMRVPELDVRDRFEQAAARATWRYNESPPRDLAPMDSYVARRWIEVAYRTDPRIDEGHLLWESDTCWPLDAFVKASWRHALVACQDALRAALWSDLIDSDVVEWLNAPWAAGLAAIDPGPGARVPGPLNDLGGEREGAADPMALAAGSDSADPSRAQADG